MKEAEKKCRKLRMGAIPYTPTYSRIRTRIEIWSLVVKKLLGGKVGPVFLKWKAEKAGISKPWERTLIEAASNRAAAYREEKRVAKVALASRTTWLEGLCTAKAEAGNLSKEQELLNMRKREEQQRNACIIRSVNAKLRMGSVTSVVAPDVMGNWVEETSKHEIERALLVENERRFNQAKDTPFLQLPLAMLVGLVGTGLAVEAILQGKFVIPPNMDYWAAKLIPHLARPQAVRQRPPRENDGISIENHCSGWEKAKEYTSSGPSGLNFGHFKAGARHPEIAEFEAIMTSIPYETGLSPARWQRGTNVMLEKKKGNFNVDKLRAILLYEADFNQNNKYIGREMMYTCLLYTSDAADE